MNKKDCLDAVEELFSPLVVEELVNTYGTNYLRGLVSQQPELLAGKKGIGPKTVRRIKALQQIVTTFSEGIKEERQELSDPYTVFEVYANMQHLNSEHFRVLFLNSKNKLIKDELVSIGDSSKAIVDCRTIILNASACGAVSCILIHNHPSGDPTPSDSDKFVTNKIQKALSVLGVKLLDHVVIGEGEFYSFRKHGGEEERYALGIMKD